MVVTMKERMRMVVTMKERMRMVVTMKERMRMVVTMKERMRMVIENLSRNQNLEMGMVAMVEEEKKAAKVTAKRLQFYPLFAFFFLHKSSSFNCHGLTQSKYNSPQSFLKY
jgi:hypothetical protein